MVEHLCGRVLLVEDNPGDARLFREVLANGAGRMLHVDHEVRLEAAIARLQAEAFDVVVLDLTLPDASGTSGLNKIREKIPGIPIVVISGLADEDVALEAVRAGAQDYLLKGRIDEFMLSRCLHYAIERARLQDQVARLAQQDNLTGLANRNQFKGLLDNALRQTGRSDRLVGLMMLDMDGFKVVNDTLGHPVGDKLLQIVAQRLSECVRASDSVVRLGGDEFAVIATNNDSADGIAALAQRIIERLASPFVIDGNEVTVGASIGITIYPNDPSDSDGLHRNADIALYRAKEQGRGRYKIYDEMMDRQVRASQSLETDLRMALARGQIELHYQPQYELLNQELVGVEALLRWHHPQRGIVPPCEFLQLAEKSRLILEFDAWALEAASRQAKAWQSDGLPTLTMSVNVSAANFRRRRWSADVEAILHNVGLDPSHIELEITESVAMSFRRDVVAMIERLAGVGIGIAIDDFGTGFSSLTHLKHLPINCIKIDRSFVHGMTNSPQDAAICFSVIHLGHSLQLRVVAEGIETKSQFDMLCEHGCDDAQGFYFAKPMPADEMTSYLRAQHAAKANGCAVTSASA